MAEAAKGPKRAAGGDSLKGATSSSRTTGSSSTRRSGSTPARKSSTSKRAGTAAKASGKRTAGKKNTGKKPMGLGKKIGFGLLTLLLLLAIIATIGGIAFYNKTELPDPNADFTTQTTTVNYADGSRMGQLAIQNRHAITYQEMPQSIKDAVVAAEDRSFWTNQGIDVKGMSRALFRIATGGDVQGGSTITQQYIKIRYLTSEQTLNRKFTELVLAMKMNKAESKEDTLAGYLNTIYFGRGAYGVQAAAQTFFGVDAKDLSVPQSAVLASVINSPSNFDPANGPKQLENLTERYNYVIDGMQEMGAITAEQHDAAYNKLPALPEVETPQTYAGPQGFLIQMATDELKANGFTDDQINGGGLTITTTFDPKRQAAAVKAVQENVAASVENANVQYDNDGNVIRGADGKAAKPDPAQLHVGLVSMNVATGEIIALYGGDDYITNSINWATTPRYAASTFKIYGVVAGLRNGFGLQSVFEGDTFTPQGDPVPVQNDSAYQYGPITLQKATQVSSNTAFVDMIQKIPDDGGTEALIKAANDAGVPTHSSWESQGGRLVLGEGEVTALNNTHGFATIANQGMRMPAHVVKEVKDATGQVIYSAKTTGEQTIENKVARDTIAAVAGAASSSTHTAVEGRDVAAKTGTEGIAVGQKDGLGNTFDKQITRAAWMSGFTSEIATSVLMVAGEDGNQNLDPYSKPGYRAFYGSGYPTDIWDDYMRVAVQDTDFTPFPQPAYIQPTVRTRPQATYVPPTTQRQTQAPATTQAPTTSAPAETTKAPETSAPPATTEAAPPTTQAPEPTTAPTEQPTQAAPTNGQGNVPPGQQKKTP